MLNSVNEDQEKQDQGKKTAMADSTMMTVEFLRARLLSERSVSRTARQRADELAKRVMELEEQLKIVTLRRKQAEKATTEVLAILENHGLSDFSEAFDSSSDQEGILSESKEDNSSIKEETSVNSKPKRNEGEDISVSGLEGSPLTGRSLSWKKSMDSSNSLEKKKSFDQSRRRRINLPCNGGSSSKRLGKSCRQIKRREALSVVGDGRDESLLLDAIENGSLKEGSQNEEVMENLEDQRNVSNGVHYVNGSRRDADMERALEQQAQLIGRYEAEENAQREWEREWEEKFRENNSYTPDSYEPGNQSDITEERDDVRAETTEPTSIRSTHDQGEKSKIEEASHNENPISNTHNSFPSPDVVTLVDESSSPIDSPEFTFPGQKKLESENKGKKKKQEQLENDSILQPSNGLQPGRNIYKGESSGQQNKPTNALTLHGSSHQLGGVLEALQRAKLSLELELNKTTSNRSLVRGVETAPPAIKGRDAISIPVGTAGLFRVPTEATFPKPNILSPYSDSSGLSLTRYDPPQIGVSMAKTGDRYMERGLTIPSFNPPMDTRMGLSIPSRYTYPSYADLMPRMASNEGFPRSYSSAGPAGDGFRLYDNQIRPRYA